MVGFKVQIQHLVNRDIVAYAFNPGAPYLDFEMWASSESETAFLPGAPYIDFDVWASSEARPLSIGRHTALEDRESVQVALSMVINALATGRLDSRRATALLYGLQLASSNAARLNTSPSACDVVQTVESSPDGLDLAEPGATRETLDYDLDDFDDEEDEDEEE